jgi:hypothetical protein
MENQATRKDLRSFGLLVGGIFAIIGFWPVVFYGEGLRWWALVIAAVLIVPALAFPQHLAWVHKQWMLLGHILGWINTRIILGGIFYLIVTPIGVVRRLLGKDPMGKQLRADLESYRVVCKPRPASHLRRQY